MTNALNQFAKDDYQEFRKYLAQKWSVDTKLLDRLAPQLKPVHKRYLSLACAATVVGQRAPRNEYLAGVVEVTRLSIVLAVKGLENSSCVLSRQSIELILKHVFFSTHPVEYKWAATRVDYKYLTFQNLLEFVKRTEEYEAFGRTPDICECLNYWFGVLSRYVHVHSRDFMGYRTVISKSANNLRRLGHLQEIAKNLWPLLAALLVIVFPGKYRRASVAEQRLILRGFDSSLRKDVTSHMRKQGE